MAVAGKHIPSLDGLRGIAALWVFIGHVMLLTGFSLPVLGRPALGVDLFIILSGFLMAFQYRLRESREPWDAPRTWRHFWVRRFFRIAPLYYVALLLALLLAPQMYEARSAIAAVVGGENEGLERYLDRSPTNVLLHLSFIFGMLPDYAFRTVLPDWSISLEVQFYAVFPILMALIVRFGWLRVLVPTVCLGAAAGMIVHHTLNFPMPAFLPLKLHLFIAGLLVAEALTGSGRRAVLFLALAIVVSALPVGGNNGPMLTLLRLAIVLVFIALIHHRFLPGLAGRFAGDVSRWLGIWPFRWIGELSYGAYLLHMLVLLPICSVIATQTELAPVQRFAAAMAIGLPLTYLLAAVGYFAIERPGQKLGRALLRWPQMAHAGPSPVKPRAETVTERAGL